MNIYKQVIALVSFTSFFTISFAMDNKPKPPSAINFNGTLKPTEFKSTLNWGGTLKPSAHTSNINWYGSLKPSIVYHNQNSSEIKTEVDAVILKPEEKKQTHQQVINQFSEISSKNNAHAAELVAVVFEKLKSGQELTTDEMRVIESRMHALQISNQHAADEAKKALN